MQVNIVELVFGSKLFPKQKGIRKMNSQQTAYVVPIKPDGRPENRTIELIRNIYNSTVGPVHLPSEKELDNFGLYYNSALCASGYYTSFHYANTKSSSNLMLKKVDLSCLKPDVKLATLDESCKILEFMAKKVNIPFVVKVHYLFLISNKLYVFMERYPGHSVHSKMKTSDRIPEKLTRQWLTQLYSVFQYIEANGIIHRSIRVEHLLLDRCFDISLTGWTRAIFVLNPVTQLLNVCSRELKCRKRNHMPPECFIGSQYNPSTVDKWSMAVVAVSMLTNRHPFIPKKIHRINYEQQWRQFVYRHSFMLDPKVVSVLNRFFVIREETRCNILELFQLDLLSPKIQEQTPVCISSLKSNNDVQLKEVVNKQTKTINKSDFMSFDTKSSKIVDPLCGNTKSRKSLVANMTETQIQNILKKANNIPNEPVNWNACKTNNWSTNTNVIQFGAEANSVKQPRLRTELVGKIKEILKIMDMKNSHLSENTSLKDYFDKNSNDLDQFLIATLGTNTSSMKTDLEEIESSRPTSYQGCTSHSIKSIPTNPVQSNAANKSFLFSNQETGKPKLKQCNQQYSINKKLANEFKVNIRDMGITGENSSSQINEIELINSNNLKLLNANKTVRSVSDASVHYLSSNKQDKPSLKKDMSTTANSQHGSINKSENNSVLDDNKSSKKSSSEIKVNEHSQSDEEDSSGKELNKCKGIGKKVINQQPVKPLNVESEITSDKLISSENSENCESCMLEKVPRNVDSTLTNEIGLRSGSEDENKFNSENVDKRENKELDTKAETKPNKHKRNITKHKNVSDLIQSGSVERNIESFLSSQFDSKKKE